MRPYDPYRSYRSYQPYRKEPSLFSRLLVIAGVALTIFGAVWFFNRPKDDGNDWMGTIAGEGGVINAQIIGPNGPLVGPSFVTSGQSGKFPAISQRDKSQYADEAEWRTWAGSACSAAALTSVLSGYGKGVRITEVLAYLRQQNAIGSNSGLYKYDVFSSIAAKYGLKAVYSEDKDLEGHFAQITKFLQQGVPVVVNVRDPNYFPNGHFVVATGFNADGTVAIVNPDPASGKSVGQNWPVDSLKLYFGRSLRSAAYLPA